MPTRTPPKSKPRPKAKPRRKPGTRARRSSGRWTPPKLRPLEPHELDLVGLALLAAGVFGCFVVYFGSAGGEVGDGARDGARFLIGAVTYLLPAALVVAGVLILARTFLPPARPLRTGLICLSVALLLGLAAETLGVGPGEPRATEYWTRADFERRGGVIGEGLYWVAAHAFSTLGAHILAVFLFVAGLILVSGATVAGVVRAASTQVTSTSQALRKPRATSDDGESRAGPMAADWEEFAPHPDDVADRFVPPEPSTEELVIRATHVEGPPVFGDEDPLELEEPPELDATLVLPDEPEPEPDSEEIEEGPAPAAEVDPAGLTPQGRYRATVTEDPAFEWRAPSARVLTRSTAEQARPDTAGQSQTAKSLVEALGHFGVEAKVVDTVAGPHITRYELRLAPGTKVNKVANLKDDLAYALAAADIRIQAPIPGKQAVGVEVPNQRRKMVHLGDVFQPPPPDASPMFVWLGKDVEGRAIGADLAKMPHLLVAGTTGAGKSGCINAMLTSILLRATPHELRMVLVDPKQVELNHYESIPHLLTPVITSPRMAANALQNLVKEMEERYALMAIKRTRSLNELNRRREELGDPALPYVLCVIDELADLMMVAPADVEDSIIRLAQKARAVGIHLVLATQSPRVDVITGMIKANVPSRIAFSVSSQTDSRVILDQNGAETLLGQGDMLFSPVGSSRLQRIQGAYVDEAQIAQVTENWKAQGEPELREELLEEVEPDEPESTGAEDDGFDPDEDPLLEEAITLVAEMGTASTSMLQRRLRLGYTRAGRLIDMLERRGVISGYEGSKPRQVLVTPADLPRVLQGLAGASAASGSASRSAEPSE